MAEVFFTNCRTEFNYLLNQPVWTRKDEFYTKKRKTFFVTLTYYCVYTLHESMVDENYVRNSTSTLEQVCLIHLNFEHVSEILDKTETIRQKLSSWGFRLTERQLEDLVKYSVQTMEMKYNEYPGYNVLDLYFKVEFEHYHDVVRRFDDNGVDRVLQLSFEASVIGMVPASDESIKSLKRKRNTFNESKNKSLKRLKESSGESCVICMEKFSEGCDAVCMPCKHEFHGGCIENWLRVSHYCPICRYEMPTT